MILSYNLCCSFFSNLVLSSWSSFNSNNNYGNSHDFGNFTACKTIDNKKLSTQYCLVQYYSNNLKFRVFPRKSLYQNIWTDLNESFLGAICLPSSCTVDNIKEILKFTNLTFGLIHCKVNINKESRDALQSLIKYGLNIERTW